MKTLKDFNFKNKRVLVRCDFNVSLDEKGRVLDDFRIKATIPTIEYLMKKGAKLILMSHLGKPKGEVVESLRLTPVQEKLMEYLDVSITKAQDCIGKEIEDWISQMQAGEILLLENLRFYKEEEENDQNFAKSLASLGDIYINDAFGACHRTHASIVGIPKHLPFGIGLLLEKELKILSKVLENPWRPLVVIIGGNKVESKLNLACQFLEKADHLLLGGGIANVILIAKRISLGEQILEKEIIDMVKKIELTNPKLHLPVDGVIALENLAEDYLREGAVGSVRKEERVFDIGPETIKIFSEVIKSAKMIFWAGPMGMSEEKKFEKGTKEIAESVVKNYSAFKIAGGGETITALNKFGLLDKFDHISTGGGAMLAFLSGAKLPGLAVLNFYGGDKKS